MKTHQTKAASMEHALLSRRRFRALARLSDRATGRFGSFIHDVLAVLFLLVVAGPVSAQNLAPNPGFEIYTACPNNNSQVTFAPPWNAPTTGTPDYLQACSTDPNYSAPNSIFGNQTPHTGNAYMGLLAHYKSSSQNTNVREYIQAPLLSPLAAGQSYTVSFYVSLADNSKWAVDSMGAYFSVGPVAQSNNFAIAASPQVSNQGGVISDKTNWVLIQGTFTANGGETHLIIGNFKDDANTTITALTGTLEYGYYFIDDVSVVAVAGGGPQNPEVAGCLKDMKVEVKCNPNGAYTVTLNGSSFSGTDITVTSQTAGVTVTPPQQPWSATTTWTVTGATAGQTVVLTASATKVGGGKEGADLCCSGEIKIVMPKCPKHEVGQVIVEKKVKNDTRASNATINALNFPIGLTCGPPSTLNTSFNLNNGGSHTENNVPYGSLCTVTESTSTLPPVPKDVCPRGTTAIWLPPVIVLPSATVNAPVTAFTVVNELQCKKLGEVGSLVVKKEVRYDGPITLPSQTYPVTVTCGSTVTNLNLVPGVPQTVSNIPLNTSCSVVEGTVTTPPNVCPPGTKPVWSTAYVPPSPLIINGTVTETVTNTLTCIKGEVCLPPMVMGPGGQCICPPGTVQSGKECIKVHTCPPPFVIGPADQCICPPGTIQSGKECIKVHTCPAPFVIGPADQCICPPGTIQSGKECIKVHSCPPPMIPGPTDQCICPPGTVLKGKECVKFTPIQCRSPLIPNAAGTDCVCRPGLVQKGRRCVEQVVCKPPATLNRRGECQCPTDMVAKGNTCVERERRTPGITPGDVIRNIPGGGRDNPRGGRDTDPPRGGGRDTDPPRGGGRDIDPPRGGGPGPIDLPGRR
jgi:hypothetical protein